MICTGTEGMSTLDFYLSLVPRNMAECKGPLAYIQINDQGSMIMAHAAQHLESPLQSIIIDSYITGVNNGKSLFGSCMGHWVDICAAVDVVGKHLAEPSMERFSSILFRRVCKEAGLDQRELDNYLLSYVSTLNEE